MFGTLGGPELFLILVVALIVFGPRKLPEIGKSLGKMMAEFRKASQEFQRTIETEVEADKLRESMRIDTTPTHAPAPPAVTEPAPAAVAEPAAHPAEPAASPGEAEKHAAEPVGATVSRDPGHPPLEPK
jgi:Tat protein translocase TatB subunit